MRIFSDETVREKLRDFEDLLTTSSKRVIELGGDINSLDEDGETVFFKVWGSVDSLNCRKFIPLLNLLLDLGADTDISPPHQSCKMYPIFRSSEFPE